jgi:hypothetical protein
MIGWIIFGAYLVGAVVAFILSAFLDIEEDGTRKDQASGPAFATAIFWPFTVVLVGPLLGICFLRDRLGDWISTHRKEKIRLQEQKIRLEDKEDKRLTIDPRDIPPQHCFDPMCEEDRDYRTMPCRSCGHNVERTP